MAHKRKGTVGGVDGSDDVAGNSQITNYAGAVISYDRYTKQEIKDAEERGIKQGDMVILESPNGSLKIKANLTAKVHHTNVHLVHGMTEANANNLTNPLHLDPYSGFPGFKSVRCNLRKVEEA